MNPNDDQVEHIAQAFYVAREAGVWESAPRILKHEFRLYARQAIAMLERQHEKIWMENPPMKHVLTLETA